MQNQKDIFNKPQKIFKFLHITKKKKRFLKSFACEQIETHLESIRPSMQGDTKTKAKVDNTYEELGWKYRSICKEMLEETNNNTDTPVEDEIDVRYRLCLEAAAAIHNKN
ncbi:unnamed protein product [Amoebophrya sp. A120]|nr:unnamed protein product [Amoebophrya sp. A120]|eukprot:GSA120T00018716001.1